MTAKDRDLTNKTETVNLLVNSCVANVKPNYCHNYTEIKYLKDVSSVGHLSSANIVTNVPNVAIDPPVGARPPILGEMGSPGFESKGSNSTQRRLHTRLLVQTPFNQITNCHKQLWQPAKTLPPFGGTVSAGEQECSRTGSKPKIWGFITGYFWYPNPTTGRDLSWT